MPSDTKQYKSALRHWQELRETQMTRSAESGITAVMVPLDPNKMKYSAASIEQRFGRQAFELANHFIDLGASDAVIYHNAGFDAFADALRRSDVTRMVTLGMGTLSSIATADGLMTWSDITKLSQEEPVSLKSEFIQLQCGGRNLRFNVPFGAMAVHDHRNLFIPHGYVNGRRSPVGILDTLSSASVNGELSEKDILDLYPFAPPSRTEKTLRVMRRVRQVATLGKGATQEPKPVAVA